MNSSVSAEAQQKIEAILGSAKESSRAREFNGDAFRRDHYGKITEEQFTSEEMYREQLVLMQKNLERVFEGEKGGPVLEYFARYCPTPRLFEILSRATTVDDCWEVILFHVKTVQSQIVYESLMGYVYSRKQEE